jgi:tetratricopeptide (TPR) repeat protein
VILALAAAGHAAPSGAPAASDDDARAAYLAAVERWSAGDDAVVDAWADWIVDELARLHDRVSTLSAGAPPAVLHDAVRLHVLAAHAASQRGRLGPWRSHLDLAQALLERTGASPAGEQSLDVVGLRRDVALAEGYALLMRWQPSFALAAFKRALAARPDDGDALLAAGMAEELRVTVPALALDRYVSAPELINRGAVDDLIPTCNVQRMDYENSLRAAESFFKHAAAADPALAAEARLRLGRVLDVAGRRERAEREWSQTLEGSARGDVACLARLFLGRAAERRRDWRQAAEHYRAALLEAPGAQSAHVALAAALDQLGDRAGAREHAGAALETSHAAAGAVDPWLRYHYEPQRGLSAALARLARSAP